MRATNSIDREHIGVLVLSDFHFREDFFGSDKKCLFQTKPGYLDVFKRYLKKDLEERKIKIRDLLVLGDLSDNGDTEEFSQAEEVLVDLCSELLIDRTNVLIIPGNHDFNRGEFSSKMRQIKAEPEKWAEHQKEKFNNFTAFYDDFFEMTGKHFDSDKAIPDVLYDKQLGVVFLGINSIYKDSHREEDHVGYVNKEALQKELKVLKDKYQGEKMIALMHHTAQRINEQERKISNWDEIAPIFQRYNISTFIGSDVHTMDGIRTDRGDAVEYITCGSLSSPDTDVACSCLVLYYDKDGDNEVLRLLSFKEEGKNDWNKDNSYWQAQTSKPILRSIVIRAVTGTEGIEKRLAGIESTSESPLDQEIKQKGLQKDDSNIKEILPAGRKFLVEALKKNNLYILGNFKWSTNGHSLSYVLSDYFFDNYICLENIKACFKSIFKHFNIRPDMIIGYEMNGNVLGTLLAVDLGCRYSFIPAKDKKHTEFEKKMPKNTEGVRDIAVIIDFIFTEHLIRSLTEQIEEAFPSVKSIFFCTLFEGMTNQKKETSENDADKNGNSEEAYYRVISDEKQKISICSVYQLPMITSDYNENNCELFMKQVIPMYCLYSNADESGDL